ncbi:MAG TPA: 4-hydroxy-tetrahydrodipicolinate reductase [Steroidobacteraceae bacterium]|jgi:4-hydroxy-tetrahydrodipicolinate reductase|nr:4-hydroxy-tetrahydrodipicolinate reductase [Steroidobacteraceae bacterium]
MSARAPAPPLCAVLIGAAGRMGRAIFKVAGEFPGLAFVGALASGDSALLGRDSGSLAGGAPNHLPITSDLGAALARAQVVIDFSTALATRENLRACRAAHKPLLLGTTGFAADLEAELAAAAAEIPLLVAPNTSLAVTLLGELARRAAQALPGFAIGITETHHRDKRDAPSGTALALAAAIREARPGQIPISSVREGEVVGEHCVHFAGPGEELALTHRALAREVFARGALAAALWLSSQAPGRYDMRDVMGFKTAT